MIFFQGHAPTSEQRDIARKAVDSLEREQKVHVTYNDGGGISVVDVYDCARAEAEPTPIVDLDDHDVDTQMYFEDETELDPSPGMPELIGLVHQELLRRVNKEGKIYAETYDTLVREITATVQVRTSPKEVASALQYLYKLGLRENLRAKRRYARVRPLGFTQQMLDCVDSMGKTPSFEISMKDAQLDVRVSSSEEAAVRDSIQKTHEIEQLQAELAAEKQKTAEFARLQQENIDLLAQNQELTDENQRAQAVLVTFRSAIDMELER